MLKDKRTKSVKIITSALKADKSSGLDEVLTCVGQSYPSVLVERTTPHSGTPALRHSEKIVSNGLKKPLCWSKLLLLNCAQSAEGTGPLNWRKIG